MPDKISDEIKAKCGCAFSSHCFLFLEVLHFAFVFGGYYILFLLQNPSSLSGLMKRFHH